MSDEFYQIVRGNHAGVNRAKGTTPVTFGTGTQSYPDTDEGETAESKASCSGLDAYDASFGVGP